MSDDSVPAHWVEQRVKRLAQHAQEATRVFAMLRGVVQTDAETAKKNIAGATFTFQDIQSNRFGVVREPIPKRDGRVWSRVFELSGTKVSVSDEDSNIVAEASVVLRDDDWMLQLKGLANLESPGGFSKLVLEPLFFPESPESQVAGGHNTTGRF